MGTVLSLGNRFLKYLLHQVEGTITENPNIEETLRYNISHQLERLVTQLSNIPTKDDFAALQARLSTLNETCKAAVELKVAQAAVLGEIRPTSSSMSQNISAHLAESESSKPKLICDRDWVVIQRRGTQIPLGEDRTNFERIWKLYANGFGTFDEDFWLGLGTMFFLGVEGYTQLRVDLEDWDGDKKYSVYDMFKVASAQDNYILTVGGYWGTADPDAIDYLKEFSYNRGEFYGTIVLLTVANS
ncbi:fibroleukin [Folsomia candida]|uniref:fibroleukin n=1 Tax=Folsomia candida TaxID=158441 RepID=UPI001604ED02|nr:fibroleukin [Folsomia candida]